MKIKGKLLGIQLSSWLIGEIILHNVALDEVADYTHFRRQKKEELTLLIENQITISQTNSQRNIFL